MKAIRAHYWGAPRGMVVDEIQRPEPQPEQILVEVHTPALNFPDLLLIAGKYQVKPDLPFTPGLEVAGTIEHLGDGVDTFQLGHRVLAPVAMGGFAEYTVAPARGAPPMPGPMSYY